ncbi:hypothetical protein M513_08886, partial [Trichuris suis]
GYLCRCAVSSKRKWIVLSLKEKSKIIEALERRESGRSLSEKYGVGAATVSAIKKRGDVIQDYSKRLVDEVGCTKRKVMRSSKVEEVEEALYVWFIQNRIAGNPTPGPVICEKALYFNAMLNADPDVKSSQGWLSNFKKCLGIRAHDAHGEKLAAVQCSSNSFREKLKNFLIEGGYEDDFIYNADETGLNWKALPTKSLIARWEECAPGCKRRKERATLTLCANSSGTHRLPLFLVGKSKNPRSFKNVKLPVRYSHQKQAWVNFHVFKEWFEGTFIPEVKTYQSSIGKTGKVLLLIDNAPAHPSAQYIDAVDEFVTVKFLPPNVTPLIQPMDQGVIANFKRSYRKQLLRELLLSDDNTVETVTNLSA